MFLFNIHENQVTRICDKTPISSTNGLPSCNSTRMACVTFSRNRQYAYKCQETNAYQERRGESRQVTFTKTSLLKYIFKLNNLHSYRITVVRWHWRYHTITCKSPSLPDNNESHWAGSLFNFICRKTYVLIYYNIYYTDATIVRSYTEVLL